jgi:hypothetical protein
MEPSDVPNAEACSLAEFARIDQVAVPGEAFVEFLESKPRIAGFQKRRDDRALMFGGKKGAETQARHASEQCAVIGLVAGGAGGHAAFVRQFPESAGEGEQRVRGRGEAELSVGFKAAPLLVEIEAEAA